MFDFDDPEDCARFDEIMEGACEAGMKQYQFLAKEIQGMELWPDEYGPGRHLFKCCLYKVSFIYDEDEKKITLQKLRPDDWDAEYMRMWREGMNLGDDDDEEEEKTS